MKIPRKTSEKQKTKVMDGIKQFGSLIVAVCYLCAC